MRIVRDWITMGQLFLLTLAFFVAVIWLILSALGLSFHEEGEELSTGMGIATIIGMGLAVLLTIYFTLKHKIIINKDEDYLQYPALRYFWFFPRKIAISEIDSYGYETEESALSSEKGKTLMTCKLNIMGSFGDRSLRLGSKGARQVTRGHLNWAKD